MTTETDYEASAHDVAAAYCLAMADVRVRLPLGALYSAYGKAWQFRLLRKQEIVGSNPTAPTDTPSGCRLRWGPCWYGQAPVKRTDTGSIPVTAAQRKDKPMGDGSCLENSRAMSLVSSTLTPSAVCALDRAAKVPVFQTGEAGSIPAGHSGREHSGVVAAGSDAWL